MEVVTEARVLKLELPAAALEAGIRTFAAGELGTARRMLHERLDNNNDGNGWWE
jgi:hypothetical protein